MTNVIEYMLQANKDTDRDVALEACEFWYAENLQLGPHFGTSVRCCRYVVLVLHHNIGKWQ